MSMRHLFGFDHIPVGIVDVSAYYDTRLKFFVGEGSTQSGQILSGGWITGSGSSTYQGLIAQAVQDTPTHLVFGFRAKHANASAVGTNSPFALYLNGVFNNIFTQAELVASKVASASGDYFSIDINLTTGVMRRWIGNLELAPITSYPVTTLKTAQYLFCTQAYQGGYAAYQYRDFYFGDNFDGVDVQVLGDRVVRSQPVKTAAGANWAAADGGSLVTALNKAWVTGATDVTALNQTDNGAIRVQFNPGVITPDIDAVQIEVASSVAGPTNSIKVARAGDATGKTTARSGAIGWGARSPIYTTKADGSKISSVDFGAMNFDISGV